MPEESSLELSIDPLTGTTNLSEGSEVHIKDDRGRVHRALVLAVVPGAELRYDVLLTCHGVQREVTVSESDILARTISERDV